MTALTRLWLAALAITNSLAAAQDTGIKPPRQPHPPTGSADGKLLTFNDTVVAPTLSADSLSLEWVSGDEDGLVVYLSETSGALILENFITQENSTLVPAEDVPADYWEYWVRSDLSKVLFSVNYTKQYRYSYFADYVVYDVESGETSSLVDDSNGDVLYAELAPTGEMVVFSRGNDLFVKDLGTGSTERVTNDGGPDLFHGVPDWVYEEEILGGRKAFW